ncbi:hypothetical protein [Halorubrum kocurii]|uniref:DUF1102 domain-containing protein n=1 Tax=Halorubrum kocurii JCM 14978 TaxID=1230456 RepID=M0NUU9_9EURY|nr:hypothetical protein [Halorubrum kocurii]EMA61561.1 hypothetical protein C468_11840 [Halorubrum kocurii JCM 14978]
MAGLGALASGSAAAIGTGAFSSVEAERDVTVEVGGDNSAYLGLEAERDDIISDDGGDGQLSLDLGSQTTKEGGDGFNQDAETEIDGVFKIINQGTETVFAGFSGNPDDYLPFAGIEPTAEPIAGVELEVQNSTNVEGDIIDGAELEPGDSTLVDVTVDTLNEDPEEESGEVVIGALVEDY